MSSSTSSFRRLAIASLPYIVLAILGLYGIRGVMYRGIRSNEVGEFAKLKTLFVDKNDYDLLYIGTSRCETSFNPPIIDSITGLRSFNAGIMGSGFPMQSDILKAYLVHSKPPRFVVINADIYDLDRENEINQFPRYFAFLENDALRKGLRIHDKRIEYFRWFAPYTLAYLNDRYRYAAARGFTGHTIAFDRSFVAGFVPAERDLTSQFEQLRDTFFVTGIDSAKADLQRLIDVCMQNGIQPILVASPSSIEIIQRLDDLDAPTEALTDIATRNRIPFLNYVLDSLAYDRSFFADPNHLNNRGAELFSRKVGKDLSRYAVHSK